MNSRLGMKNTKMVMALAIAIPIFTLAPSSVFAHVSEQGFVLLLPTRLYIISGTAAVAITLLVITLIPASVVTTLFQARKSGINANIRFENTISVASTFALLALVFLGFYGPYDPLKNLLPLVIWTLWWQGFLFAQAIFGNLWHWLNPWTGIYHLIKGDLDRPGFLQLPAWLGRKPGILAFVLFTTFSLVDIAPDNPARLAVVVLVYWFYTFAGMIIFGARDWLDRAECFTMLFRLFSLLSVISIENEKVHLGFPGWRLINAPKPDLGIGILAIMMLAAGSFDGLNETFWWLGNIGINPLEFPGRSEVIWPNLLGLLAAVILLPVCFATCIYIGLRLADETHQFPLAFAGFALTVIPIATGYHFSHYLTSFMVNIQYALAAFSDPLGNGADYLHLGRFYVTSGFLNSHHSVKVIWLLQAALVVAGHIIAVLLSHCLAIRIFANSPKATNTQMPLAMFMISYTVFGLWLLASPRGL